MNNGTKFRTIVSIIAAINMVLIAFNIDIFEGSTENVYYLAISCILMVVTWFFSHYKNNDYSPEACQGTGLTRLLKSYKKGVNGENFMDTVDEVSDEDEEVEEDA